MHCEPNSGGISYFSKGIFEVLESIRWCFCLVIREGDLGTSIIFIVPRQQTYCCDYSADWVSAPTLGRYSIDEHSNC